MVHACRASIELWMHAGSWESTREAFQWHEAKPSASLASRVLSQLTKCIHNSIDAQLKHEPFLLEHCHCKRNPIKYRILLNHSERFDWLNAITRFDIRKSVRLSRFTKSMRKIASYVLNIYTTFKRFWKVIRLRQNASKYVIIQL